MQPKNSVEQLNRIEVETRGGNRTFELLCGDIVKLEHDVDLLVVSAYKERYSAHAASVIGALQHHLSIDAERLAAKPDLDFRDALDCWVARAPRKSPFRHLLCVEVFPERSSKQTVKQLFSNVFATIAALEAKGYKLRTIAMPPLATGRSGLDPDLVMRAMLEHSLEALERSRTLRTVQFVVRDETFALQFSDAMDRVLGRAQVLMPQGAAIQMVRRKIAGRLETAALLSGANGSQVFDELRKAILSPESRPFVLGVSARKVVEFIVHDLMAGKKFKDVNTALKQLSDQQDGGPALWIVYYMEVIRTLGNNGAHASVSHQRQPAQPTSADLELLLLCLLRVLDFWIERKQDKQQVMFLDAEQDSQPLVNDLLPG
ncbi:MAG: hypothetical protein RLZZ387_3411 [Chloroflexota bacterium]|jgi:hypothetical protein